MSNDITIDNEQDTSSLRKQYHAFLASEGIWIERRAEPHTTLWETHTTSAYTLVDDDHQPLRDEQGEEYRFETVAHAERKIRELLTPMLSRLARTYAENMEEVPA